MGQKIQKDLKNINGSEQSQKKSDSSLNIKRLNKLKQNGSMQQNVTIFKNQNVNNSTKNELIAKESFQQDNDEKSLIVKEPANKSLLSLISAPAANKQQGDDPSCTFSEVLHNATLRGNLQSGKFSDRGEMDDIRQCVRLCCMLKGCDLAFMLKQKCFTVQCRSKYLCEPVQAKSVTFSPMLCYILVKSAAG